MEFGLFKKIVNEMKHYPTSTLLICGIGEPSVHPNIERMLDYAGGQGISHTLYTNGNFFRLFTPDRILKWNMDSIVVSIDGIDGKTYETVRKGGDYQILRNSVAAFYQARTRANKSKPQVEVRHVIFADEDKEALLSFRMYWKVFSDTVKFNVLQPVTGDTYEFPGPLRRCRDIRRKMHIRWDGGVPICGYQYRHSDYLWVGNANDASIADLWLHPTLQKIRSMHKKHHVAALPYCKCCMFTQS